MTLWSLYIYWAYKVDILNKDDDTGKSCCRWVTIILHNKVQQYMSYRQAYIYVGRHV